MVAVLPVLVRPPVFVPPVIPPVRRDRVPIGRVSRGHIAVPIRPVHRPRSRRVVPWSAHGHAKGHLRLRRRSRHRHRRPCNGQTTQGAHHLRLTACKLRKNV